MVSRTSSNDGYAWTGAYDVVRPYAANGLNQYTSAGPASFAYDANGNLTSDGSTSFVYDAENRLVSASGAKNATLAYDPLGRLWQVTSGTSVTRFLYDPGSGSGAGGDKVIEEHDGAGTRLRFYAHGPGTDEPLIWYELTGGPVYRFLHADHQGSIVAAASTGGVPLAINSYDPWGIPGAGNAGRFGYTGQAWIPELGLWYYKARFYSPTLGRFMQVDPIGYEDQINLYAYVDNDPVNGTDPTGTARCEGDPRCAQVHLAAAEARRRVQHASGELRSLAAAVKSGSALSASQQSLLGAFQKKFGGGSEALLNRVAGRLAHIGQKIGAEGSGVRINFGAAKGNALASASIGGNSITIRPLFFSSTTGISQASVIFHEGGHSSGLRDMAMPSAAPRTIGRESLGKMRGYGVSAADWLGANDPERAYKNNDNYHCFVIPTCGGP